jgi:N4-gp56 family major capsid protein
MAINTTTSLSNQFQRFYSKKLLMHAENTLVLNQFAKKAPLPKGLGSKTIRFFRRVTAASANVQTLTEGTPLATYTDLTYTPVDVDLIQLGELARFTDILGWTALTDVMDDGIQLLGEDCALKADDVTLAVLAHATTGATKRYSGGAANYAALAALTQSTGKFVATDGLDAVTNLVINLAPRIDGGFVGIVGPQVARDLRIDARWLDPNKYKDSVNNLFKYEIGSLDGVRYVMTTNVWSEDATEGTRDTTIVPADQIYLTIFTGKEGFGVVALDGQSPMSPKVMICDGPDKSDGLNQFISVGWKAFYNAAVLNSAWVIAVRSLSQYS